MELNAKETIISCVAECTNDCTKCPIAAKYELRKSLSPVMLAVIDEMAITGQKLHKCHTSDPNKPYVCYVGEMLPETIINKGTFNALQNKKLIEVDKEQIKENATVELNDLGKEMIVNKIPSYPWTVTRVSPSASLQNTLVFVKKANGETSTFSAIYLTRTNKPLNGLNSIHTYQLSELGLKAVPLR